MKILSMAAFGWIIVDQIPVVYYNQLNRKILLGLLFALNLILCGHVLASSESSVDGIAYAVNNKCGSVTQSVSVSISNLVRTLPINLLSNSNSMPITIHSACTSALSAATSTWPSITKWSISEIAIKHVSSLDRYFYVVKIDPCNISEEIKCMINIFVLMDGTVILPDLSKRQDQPLNDK